MIYIPPFSLIYLFIFFLSTIDFLFFLLSFLYICSLLSCLFLSFFFSFIYLLHYFFAILSFALLIFFIILFSLSYHFSLSLACSFLPFPFFSFLSFSPIPLLTPPSLSGKNSNSSQAVTCLLPNISLPPTVSLRAFIYDACTSHKRQNFKTKDDRIGRREGGFDYAYP